LGHKLAKKKTKLENKNKNLKCKYPIQTKHPINKKQKDDFFNFHRKNENSPYNILLIKR